MDGEGKARWFCFEVGATARVTINGPDARRAREALHGSLDGATAVIVGGAGHGLRLEGLLLAKEAFLVLVDGADPTAEVERALGEFRARRDEG